MRSSRSQSHEYLPGLAKEKPVHPRSPAPSPVDQGPSASMSESTPVLPFVIGSQPTTTNVVRRGRINMSQNGARRRSRSSTSDTFSYPIHAPVDTSNSFGYLSYEGHVLAQVTLNPALDPAVQLEEFTRRRRPPRHYLSPMQEAPVAQSAPVSPRETLAESNQGTPPGFLQKRHLEKSKSLQLAFSLTNESEDSASLGSWDVADRAVSPLPGQGRAQEKVTDKLSHFGIWDGPETGYNLPRKRAFRLSAMQKEPLAVQWGVTNSDYIDIILKFINDNVLQNPLQTFVGKDAFVRAYTAYKNNIVIFMSSYPGKSNDLLVGGYLKQCDELLETLKEKRRDLFDDLKILLDAKTLTNSSSLKR